MKSVRVLNNSYLPLGRCTVEKAIVFILLDRATSLIDTNDVFRSKNLTIPVPEIIVLKDTSIIRRETKAFSKRAVFERDGHKCLMCNETDKSKLSLEHLIPRSRWKEYVKQHPEIDYGCNSFLNCVTLCKPCNSWKDDRTPEEIGWEIKVAEPYTDFEIDWNLVMEKMNEKPQT